MRTSDFQYDLPPELIAQEPAPRRDAARLLVLHRAAERLEHRHFPDLLEYLRPGDVLVLNDSQVLPARLRGCKATSGGEVEVLLCEAVTADTWWGLLRPGKRVRPGTRLVFRPVRPGLTATLSARVEAKNAEGLYRLRFAGAPVWEALEDFGEVPLPPYIIRHGPPRPEDRARYQTVYARVPGSVAAPTAGLHFTPELLECIRSRGVEVQQVTLHVGLGTFAPVKAARVEDHVMHQEWCELPDTTAAAVNAARAEGRRVLAVGTTSVRVLESAATESGQVRPGARRTRLFIYPPYRFRVVDALLTNFHLPGSTLLMLVSAFAAPGETRGRECILRAYAEAVRARYRFFSYGDAMLLL